MRRPRFDLARLVRMTPARRRPLTAHHLARRVWEELTENHSRERPQDAVAGALTVDPFPLQLPSGPVRVELDEDGWSRLDAEPGVLEEQVLRRVLQIQLANSRRFTWGPDGPPGRVELHLVAAVGGPRIRVVANPGRRPDPAVAPVIGRLYTQQDTVLVEVRPPRTTFPVFGGAHSLEVLADVHGAVILTSPRRSLRFREIDRPDSSDRFHARGSCRLEVIAPSGEVEPISFRPQPRRPVIATSGDHQQGDPDAPGGVLRGWRTGTGSTTLDLVFGPTGSDADVEGPFVAHTRVEFSTVSGEIRITLVGGRASLGSRELELGQAERCSPSDAVYIDGKLKLRAAPDQHGFEIHLAEPARVSVTAKGLEPDEPCTWQRVRVDRRYHFSSDGFLEIEPSFKRASR